MQRRGPDRDGRPPVPYLAALALVTGGCFWGVWIALVGQPDLQDNLAGIAVAAVGLAVGWLVSGQGHALPRLRAADLVEVARFGPRLVTETVALFVATWRRARHRGRPGGYRTVGTDVAGGGWRAAQRSGVVGALLSFTPATICIDVDAETGVATLHDFVTRDGRQ